MWHQTASLKTVREYGESYFKAREKIQNARVFGSFKDYIIALGAYRSLDKKTRIETGLSLKTCAGFVIPAKYEGQCA